MTPNKDLARAIHAFIADLPAEWVEMLAEALDLIPAGNWSSISAAMSHAIPQPEVRASSLKLIDLWRAHAADIAPQSVALAMRTASQAEQRHRESPQLELVWTGPDSHVIPLRRTDQALLQVINEAVSTLHIVSFAVYRAQSIARALVTAAARGVSIAIYLETPEASEGRIAYDTLSALGDEVARCARIYLWPLDQRTRTPDGRHGSLHAKIAVADEDAMLISSANLTEYAMTLNMEMGIMVRGGPLPGQVAAHLGRLVEMGVFREIAR